MAYLRKTSAVFYEFGAWTPTCSGITIGVANASYTRVGNRVDVSAYINIDQSLQTGDFIIAGLPFSNTGGAGAAGSIYMRNLINDTNNGPLSIIIASGSQFYIRHALREDSGSDALAIVDAGSSFWCALTYETV
jgi:hypothetical protein|tara:strand:+ start:295 stop:696 length:402 start_codon:yes stop_codon:yes gene_type:complete